MSDNIKIHSLLKNNKTKIPSSLGKGLSALLSDATNQTISKPDNLVNQVLDIPLDKCVPSKHQARVDFNLPELEKLSESITQKGVLQPILIKQMGDKYEIIAGERRCRASILIGKKTIPAIILNATDADIMEMGLIENLHRKDLNVVEEAMAYKKLLEQFNYTHENIAKLIGKSRSHISNYLRILTLPAEVLKLLQDGVITVGHAKLLVVLPEPINIAAKIIELNLSVQETEQLIKNLNKPKAYKTPSKRKIINQELALWSTNVNLQNKKIQINVNNKTENSGEIKIKFQDIQALKQLLNIKLD